jgi:hypothetical protein
MRASTAALAVTIVTQVLYMRSYTSKLSGLLQDTKYFNKLAATLYYEFLPGCFFWAYHASSTIEWRVWCASLRLTLMLQLIGIVGSLPYL